MRRLPSIIPTILLTLALGAPLAADNWPLFRGESAGVATDDPRLPERWNATENVIWRTEIPGLGWGSPVIWGDHVFLTSVVSPEPTEAPKPGLYLGNGATPSAPHRWMVYDIDAATGKVRWEREVHRAPPGVSRHLKNSYASETAVTDGERVVFYFGNLGLFAFDLRGTPLWSREIGPFRTRDDWGPAASPALHDGRVYVVHDNEEQSFLAAFDANTGRALWRVNRDEGSNWSTPFVWKHDLRTEIVTAGSDRVRSYDLSGTLLWEFRGMSSITIATPFTRHGLLYISSGYIGDAARPTYAIRPGASGDISLKDGERANAFIAWADPTGAPYNPTPLVYGDIHYSLHDRGFFEARDARTGKEIYPRRRVATEASGFTASPWAYNGRVFALSEDGDTYVIQAGPEFEVVATNPLGEMALATPAIADGSLFIRTVSALYRIGTRTPQAR
ncbi:MAG: serine/threonine protein kinase [Acidimicrobiia bacterium]|nr:serine/threonine protein kinase [Acidimicrobiia bacterium]